MKKKSIRRRRIVRSQDLNIVVRSFWRAEPDYDKYVKAALEFVIAEQRKRDPDSVKWYDERYPYCSKNSKT